MIRTARKSGLRQSIRRCQECVAAGNQLVLMKKGRKRSEEDECPICNLLLPLDVNQSWLQACCMKRVCKGCILAAAKRGMKDCPFCRTHTPNDGSEILAMTQKRVDAGDPMAILCLGNDYRHGAYGLEKNVTRAVELYERAAELGVKEAHFTLGVLYGVGKDVERDTAKAIRHYETAAMSGHVSARLILGRAEGNAGYDDLALQHFLIAAKMGNEASLENVKSMFMGGDVTKAQYAEALRGYQSAVDETRSPDRDEVATLELYVR